MQLIIQSGDLGPKWFHVALRAMVLMGQSSELLTSNEIAEEIGAEVTFVRKILKRLSTNGLVESHGGRYGGYTLGKEPNQIVVNDIYTTLGNSPPTPHWSVPTTGSEFFISLIIAKAEEEFQSVLKKFTIEDIMNNINIV